MLGGLRGGISNNGLGYNVARKLMRDYEDQGYHLFCDNFYSSVTLARHLYERGILYTGSILKSGRDFPASLKGGKEWAKKKPRGAMRWEKDPPCPCFAVARQQSGVYDKCIRQCKRQGTDHP